MNRMDMYNQMYAEGDEVRRRLPGRFENVAEKVASGRRPGSTGPNVQRNMPGRMTGVADKVLTGSGRPPVGTMATPKTGLLPTQTLSKMGTLSRGGIGGLIAAGGLGLFEIGRQTGFEPEKLGQAAAQVQKSIEEVANEAVEVARELGQPIQDFVNRVVMGYQSEMDSGRMMSDMDRNEMQKQNTPFIGTLPLNQAPGMEILGMQRQELSKGDEVSKFPDLTGDGKVTQADILKGRGVFQEGGAVEGEIDKGLEELQGVAPEAMVIQQVMTMVMEMMQSGASEEQIVAALKEMGLDEEDIQQVMMMVAEQMQGQDSIDGQLAQMM